MTTTLAVVQTHHDVDLLEEVGCEVYDFTVDYEFSDWTQSDKEKVIKFCDELEDIGITTVERFTDRLYTVRKEERGMSAEAVFAEEFIDDNYMIDESWIVVDYQLTWDTALRHDFTTLQDCNGFTYFFGNIY